MKKLTYEECRKVMDEKHDMLELGIPEYGEDVMFDKFLKELEEYRIVCEDEFGNVKCQAIIGFETDSEALTVPCVDSDCWYDGLQSWRYDWGWFMIRI